MDSFVLNDLSHKVIGCAIKVHTALGPGLLESAYEMCLIHELKKAGIKFEQQVVMPLVYDGIEIASGYRLDILVEKNLILELKAVENIHAIHEAQLMTYLKISGLNLGLLMNFNVIQLRDGITRIVNKFPE